MSRKAILFTVGTSIRSSLNESSHKLFRENPEAPGELIDKLHEIIEDGDIARAAGDDIVGIFKPEYHPVIKSLAAGDWKGETGGNFPTAEFSSSFRWAWEHYGEARMDEKCLDELDLYFFSGYKKPFCYLTGEMARFLWWIAGHNNILRRLGKVNSYSMDVPVSVETKEDLSRSIDALFNNFDKIKDKFDREAGEEVIINTTGSYKAISAYALLYAQISNLSAIYSFEKSKQAIELPPLPLGFAIDALDEEISLLKALSSNPDLFTDARESLPRWVRGLFHAFGETKTSHLAISLIRQFEQSREGGGVVGQGLLDQFKKCGGTDASLREYVTRRIRNEWLHLWLGDQIPETVEHSRRHSKRLMEIAANFCRALTDEEREHWHLSDGFAVALLIASIYLHDIGHTAVGFPIVDTAKSSPPDVFPIGLFPSAVREVHHHLTFDMLAKDYRDSGGAIFFPHDECLAADTRAKLARLVPLICVSHRKHMALARAERSSPNAAVKAVGTFLYGPGEFENRCSPLEDRLNQLMEEGIINIREKGTAMKVAALLRIIDACDVQTDRVVSKKFIKARLTRTLEEAKALKRQFYSTNRKGVPNKIIKLVKSVLETAQLINPEEAVEGTINLKIQEDLQKMVKSIYPLIFTELRKKKEKAGKGVNPFGSFSQSGDMLMSLTVLSLANRIAFKWEQFLHFYKHHLVEYVLPYRDPITGNLTISININPDVDPNKVFKSIQEITEEMREEITCCQEVIGPHAIFVKTYTQQKEKDFLAHPHDLATCGKVHLLEVG